MDVLVLIGPTNWSAGIFLQAAGMGCFIPVYALVREQHINSVGGKVRQRRCVNRQKTRHATAYTACRFTCAITVLKY